jgi:predicted metal-dependent HD superfamily phosphohydrolase
VKGHTVVLYLNKDSKLEQLKLHTSTITTMLQQTFIDLLANYTSDKNGIQAYWLEIEKNYSKKNRHYHNMAHLNHLLQALWLVKDNIENWETILFTLYYHDIVYNALKSNNEAKSAELATKRMQAIAVPDEKIALCESQILATKSHQLSTNSDTNYFTDADLSILGASEDVYRNYYQNVRKEYSIYPDMIYKPGRKKVLQHFLTMDSIFKTPYFYEKFETQARKNLQMELDEMR